MGGFKEGQTISAGLCRIRDPLYPSLMTPGSLLTLRSLRKMPLQGRDDFRLPSLSGLGDDFALSELGVLGF